MIYLHLYGRVGYRNMLITIVESHTISLNEITLGLVVGVAGREGGAKMDGTGLRFPEGVAGGKEGETGLGNWFVKLREFWETKTR